VNIYGYVKFEDPTYRALAMLESKVTNKKHEQLLNEGWELVLDNNFESIEQAYDIMEHTGVFLNNGEEIQAYKNECKMCNWYLPTTKQIGQYWDESYSKPRKKLFNGHVCEQCLNEFETVKFEGRMITPGEMERIQINKFMKKGSK
jgi:hypothetical protein